MEMNDYKFKAFLWGEQHGNDQIVPLDIQSDLLLEDKWNELTDINFDESDTISGLILAKNWWIFPAGTDREEIWHYFDEKHSKGVAYLLYKNFCNIKP
jgi:hypothetical protein